MNAKLLLLSFSLALPFAWLSFMFGCAICLLAMEFGADQRAADAAGWTIFGAAWATMHHLFWNFARDYGKVGERNG